LNHRTLADTMLLYDAVKLAIRPAGTGACLLGEKQGLSLGGCCFLREPAV